MLDFFSETHWLYILQIDLTGLFFFLILDLPWQFVRHREAALAKSAASLS